MPLCGFDKGMIQGLDSFLKGLEEATIRKPTPVQQNIGKEVAEIAAFMDEARALPQPQQELLLGLWGFSRGFYQLASARISEGQSPEESFRATRSYVLGMLADIDTKYYGELENQAEPMKQLVAYVDARYCSR